MLAREKTLIYNRNTMKRKALFLLPLLVLPLFLSYCNKKETVQLTYGTYIGQDINSLNEIDNTELYDRLINSKETLILATYQGQYSEDCLCWNTFQNVIANYVNKYHEQVYVYDAQALDESLNELYTINKFEGDSRPDLYIYQGKKQIAHFYYSKMQDKKIFEDTSAEYMYKKIHEYIDKPSLYYVDDNYLNKNLDKVDDAILLFIRNKCGDCNYVLPNNLIPYIDKCKFTKEIWLFDLQEYYDLQNEDTTSSFPYKVIKTKYQLTEEANQKYGYLEGVVPTIQYYQKGELKDASVFFNDVLDQRDDGTYYVSNSFYTEERLANIQYTHGVKTVVLKGLDVPEEEVIKTKSGGFYWSQEKASIYHTPLFEAFLNYYL